MGLSRQERNARKRVRNDDGTFKDPQNSPNSSKKSCFDDFRNCDLDNKFKYWNNESDGSCTETDSSDSEFESEDFLFQNITEDAFAQWRDGMLEKIVVKTRFAYSGTSQRTIRRKNSEMRKAREACPMPSIESFWNQRNDETLKLTAVKDKAQSKGRANSETLNMDLIESRKQEIETFLEKRSISLSRLQWIQYLAVLKYMEKRLDGFSKEESSEQAKECIPSEWVKSARCIRNWGDFYIINGKLMESKKGKHQKTKSLINDEDVHKKCLDWLRKQPKNQRIPRLFLDFLNDELIPSKRQSDKAKISLRTATRWMQKLGYQYGSFQKDVFIDGHERDDVVEYRKIWSKFMTSTLFPSMRTYSGESMDQEELLVDPSNELVWITHDESVFYANDDGGKGWSSKSDPDLSKKGKGRSVMVSEFLCVCHGRLFQTKNGKKEFVTEILHVGKNAEGYWTNEHVVNQLETKAIPAFKEMHPGLKAVWTFDHSTNHAAYSQDALVASRMNMNPGGKQAVMRDGWFFRDGVRLSQPMVYPPDHPVERLQSQPKGLRAVLQERNLWQANLRITCPEESKVEIRPGRQATCCARHVMASQQDFLAQTSVIEEIVKQSGSMLQFFPKYHCECNWIEFYWGNAKASARLNCDYSFAGLCQHVPEALANVPLSSIRKYARRAMHYIEAYESGLNITLAKFAHKKYKSHRRLPEGIAEQIVKEFENKQK